jgi:hypothetical protein
MFAEKRPEQTLGWSWFFVLLGAALAIYLNYSFMGKNFFTGRFIDSDDLLRLKQVRDLLDGKSWFDVHEPRIGAPFGLETNWSRLLDGLIALAIRVTQEYAGRERAEYLVQLFYPLALIVPAVVAIAVVANRFGGRLAATFASIQIAASFTPAFFQFRPGRIDHHNMQSLLALVLFATLVRLNGRTQSGIAVAVALSLMLAVGFETLPFAGIALAALAVRYIVSDTRDELLGFCGALILVLPALHFAQTGEARMLVPVCDMLGWNMVAALLGGAIVTAAVLIAGPEELSRSARISVIVFGAIIAGGLWVNIHPICIKGPFAESGSAYYQEVIKHTAEMTPINPSAAIESFFVMAVAPILFALSALFLLFNRERASACLIAGAFIVVAGVMSVMMTRNFPYGALFGTPVTAAGLAFLAQRMRNAIVRTSAVPLLLIFTVPFVVAFVVDRVARPNIASRIQQDVMPCNTAADYARLAKLPKGYVFVPINMGVPVVLLTHHSVDAAPYHRISEQALANYRVFKSSAATAHDYVRGKQFDYVIACRADSPAGGIMGTFAENLSHGIAESWLEPVDTTGPVLIWKVRKS